MVVIDTVIFYRRMLFGMEMHTNPQLIELQISQHFLAFYLAILMIYYHPLLSLLILSSTALIFVNFFCVSSLNDRKSGFFLSDRVITSNPKRIIRS